MSNALQGKIRIRFNGPPSHESGRFVEVEDAVTGASITLGEWQKDTESSDCFLVMSDPRLVEELAAALRACLSTDLTECWITEDAECGYCDIEFDDEESANDPANHSPSCAWVLARAALEKAGLA